MLPPRQFLVSSRHPLIHIASVFLHPRRQQIVAFPQTEHSRITRLIGQLATRIALRRQPHSTRVAQQPPADWAQFGNSIAGLEKD